MREPAEQPEQAAAAVPAPALSPAESWVRTLRAGLQLLPGGTGNAIESGYFGTIDERRTKRLGEFLAVVAEDARKLGEPSVGKEYFGTDAFACLFEGVLRRVNVEVGRAKLRALRGVLVNVLVLGERLPFEKQTAFLKTLDLLEATHLRILQILAAAAERKGSDPFLSHGDLCRQLGASGEAEISYVHSAMGTLADREFIRPGPVPFDDEERADKRRRRFKNTALGLEFLAFVRMPKVDVA